MSTPETFKYIPWKDVEREKLNPLIDREMLVGDQVMLARVIMKRARTCRCTIITTSRSLTFWKAR